MGKIIAVKKLSDELLADSVAKFNLVFPDEGSCLELLSDLKWAEGYVCTKCGNTNSCRGKSEFSKRCTRCKKEESATAHTLFHRCKIPLNKAFEIAFMACNFTAISSYELSRQSETRHMTCYKFQKKIQNCKNDKKLDKLFSKMITEVNRRVLASN